MQLTPAQKLIAVDRHRFRVVNCGRRFGKTTLAILEMVAKAISKPNLKIAYVAPTYQQARDIAWQELKKITEPIISNVNESRLEIELITTQGKTSTIVLRGWESIETLRGQKFDFIVIDEIASMRNWWVNWQEVIRPTLTDTKGHGLFISTPKGFNHWYDIFNLESKDEDYKSFHFTSYDNPFLPKEELDKARKELTEDRFAQEYLADFRKTEGLVYKEFSRTKHLFDDEEEQQIGGVVETIAGIDFGYTNPTAVITIKRDYDNTFWVVDEWYKTNKTDPEIADYVAGCHLNKVYPDPESPSAIEELRRRGVNIRDVVKNKDSIKNGITKIQELFKNNKLKIHKRCENLILELETYSYPDRKPLQNEQENPIKENDHALDALRYAIYMISDRNIAQQKAYSPQMNSYGPKYVQHFKI
jgi:PBSX family phage terminase large subunit